MYSVQLLTVHAEHTALGSILYTQNITHITVSDDCCAITKQSQFHGEYKGFLYKIISHFLCEFNRLIEKETRRRKVNEIQKVVATIWALSNPCRTTD